MSLRWGLGEPCQDAHFKQEPLEVAGVGVFCKLWVGFTIAPVGTTDKGPRSQAVHSCFSPVSVPL